MDESAGVGILGGLLAGFVLVYIAIIAVVIASLWKVFTKAGKPGWACLVPIYNIVVLCEIAGRPAWLVVLFLVPLINVVIGILLMVDIAKSFGKGTGFAIGLLLLGIVFWPILGFGDAKYHGPAALTAAAAA